MIELKSIMDINGLQDSFKIFTGHQLALCSLRKKIPTIWPEANNTFDDAKEDTLCPFTEGYRLPHLYGTGLYALSNTIQLEYQYGIRRNKGSAIGSSAIMKSKKSCLTNEVSENLAIIMSCFSLKEYDPTLYYSMMLLTKSISEIYVGLPKIGDPIYPSPTDQKYLAKLLSMIVETYRNDLLISSEWLRTRYTFNNDLFAKLEEKLIQYQETIKLLETGEIGKVQYENYILSTLKAKVTQKILDCDPNREFPTLIAIILKAKSFRNIEITQDSWDGGIDILASEPISDEIIGFSLKRYRNQRIGCQEVIELRKSIQQQSISKGILITSSTFSEETSKKAASLGITLMDINDIIREILDHNIGFYNNYSFDSEFWSSLASKESYFKQKN